MKWSYTRAKQHARLKLRMREIVDERKLNRKATKLFLNLHPSETVVLTIIKVFTGEKLKLRQSDINRPSRMKFRAVKSKVARGVYKIIFSNQHLQVGNKL